MVNLKKSKQFIPWANKSSHASGEKAIKFGGSENKKVTPREIGYLDGFESICK